MFHRQPVGASMKVGDLVILPQNQVSWPGLDLINDYLVKELKVVNGA